MAFKLLGKKEEVDPTVNEIKKAVETMNLPSLPKETASKPKEVYEVVDQIPVQEIRRGKREDGVIVNFITKEEAEAMINARNE